MRKRVKICGLEFDIDVVEGGKMRASSIKLPGFELIATSHNQLRMRMQQALYEYDCAQLLKPSGEDVQKVNGVPFGRKPAPATGVNAISVLDPYSGYIHICKVPQTEYIGQPGRISQFGTEYRVIRIECGTFSPTNLLVEKFEDILAEAYRNGAKEIVWKDKPIIFVLPAGFLLEAAFHFEPCSANSLCPYWWMHGHSPIQV